MGYDKQLLSLVSGEMDKRRQKARAQALLAKEKAYAVVPELKEIDKELYEINLDFAKASQREAKTNFLLTRKRDLLKAAGIDAESLNVKFFCQKCRDEGYVGQKMCDCFKRELARLAYFSSPLAKAFPKADFKNFDLSYYENEDLEQMDEVKSFLSKYASSFSMDKESLFLWGGSGLGKTFASACIAKSVMEKGYDVVYESASKIFSLMEEGHFSRDETKKNSSSRLLLCDLLIIDDLGTELRNSFTLSALYDIINGRMLEKRPTIINTNYTVKELEEMYAPRIVSRLIGEYVAVHFVGKDIRLLKKTRGQDETK